MIYLRNILKSLTASTLIRDLVLLTLVGTFYIGLSLVQTLNLIDPLSFEYHLHYESKSNATILDSQRHDLVITTVEDLDVYQAGEGLGHDVTGSSERAISEAWFWNSKDLEQIRALMNDELVSGEIVENGIVVDASIAEKLDLNLGTRIDVTYLDAFTLKSCEAPVAGITRTYRNIKRQGAPGLLVANMDACQTIWSSSLQNSEKVSYLLARTSKSDKTFQNKDKALADIWDSNSSTANQSLFVLLYFTSLGFWVFAVYRIHTGLIASTGSLRRSTIRLGGSRKKLRFAYKSVTAGASLVTIAPALVLAISVLNFGPHFAIGVDNILFVLSMQFVITWIALALFGRRSTTFRSEIQRDA